MSSPGPQPPVRPTDVAALHDRLRRRGATVAVAESLTAGLLAAALTEPPGASASFRGGVVVYASDLKVSLGGVPQAVLDAHGAVSAEVAAALAAGVRRRLTASFGVALTGVAGPDSPDGHPVGLVFVAVSGGRQPLVRRLTLAGDRRSVRGGAVAAALELLAEAVTG